MSRSTPEEQRPRTAGSRFVDLRPVVAASHSRVLSQVGQRIIEVNGQSLLGASHQEAVNTLRTAGDTIRLLVCDGFNADALPDQGRDTVWQIAAALATGKA